MEFKHTNAPVETVDYGETVIPQNRLLYLYEKCKNALSKTPGNVVEVGVYKGGTLLMLAKALKEVCPQYRVYGIDNFEGHPYSDGHPVHYKGKYSDVDKGILEKYIENQNLKDHITLFKGKVEDIWPGLNLQNISFAHIDCDLYIPIKYCCEHVPGVLNKGGMMYFDDYGHEHCPGATRAVDEIFGLSKKIQEVKLEDFTNWSCFINY
jgi:O-methyltransferase